MTKELEPEDDGKGNDDTFVAILGDWESLEGDAEVSDRKMAVEKPKARPPSKKKMTKNGSEAVTETRSNRTDRKLDMTMTAKPEVEETYQGFA